MASHSSLNHVYRTVWNEALGAMVAVAENAPSYPGGGAAPGRTTVQRSIALARWATVGQLSLAVALGWGLTRQVYANPVGGTAIQGQATMVTRGNVLTVTTQNALGTNASAINWQSFSIPTGHTTRIDQPNSASMSINRVVSNTPSVLLGTLSSNGKVVLVNQSGIAVGAGALVDTAGFTASTLGMSEQDAKAARLRFRSDSINHSSGALTVQGSIIGRGGDVVLIAPSIELAQTAVVESQGGSVVLAAGRSVEVTGRGLEGINLHVQAPADQAVNLGTLKGDAVGVFAGTLKHSGLIQATQASVEGGRVVLKASGDSYVDGNGSISATSSNGKGGSVSILGNRVALTDNARIDVSGATLGGTVLVGGDYQGQNPLVQNAAISYIGKDTRIVADSTDNGNGGKVIVWADDTTRGYGTVSARGGVNGGNGGFVEVSGHRYLDYRGRADTLAPLGAPGTLLLDPQDIHIVNTVDVLGDATFTGGVLSGGTVNPQITWSTINGQTGNVEIRTNSASTSGLGDIWIDASGVLSGPTSLTLLANRGINFQGFSLNAGSANVNLVAGWNNTGFAVSPGANNVISFGSGSSLTTTGNVWMNAGNSVTTADSTPFIKASSLTIGNTNGGSLPGGVNLPGPNLVNTLAIQSDSTTGSLVFNNAQPLSVGAGQYSINGIVATGKTAPITITTTTGAMDIAAPIVTAGDVTLTTVNTNINQSAGTITAGGTTTVSAGAGDILLTSTGNNFANIALSGGSVQVRDANALNVTALTSGTNKKVVLVAGGALTLPSTAINTGTNDLDLISGTTLTPQGDIFGTNIKLEGTTGVDVEFNVTATGTLDMLSSAGGVTQNISTGMGVITATGATTINAGAGTVLLDMPTNNFSSINATGTGTVTVYDTDALVLKGLKGSGITLVTGGAVTQAAGIVETTGTFDVTSVGGVTLTNANKIRTLSAVNTGSGGFTLKNLGLLDMSISNNPTTGSVTVDNTGDLTLINTGVTSGATGTAVVLATGGNFLNVNNLNITLSGAGSPRWLIYSTNPASNTVGTLLTPAVGFQQYATAYPGSAAQAAGNGLIYTSSSTPVTATLVGPVTKVFDGTATASLSTSNYAMGATTDALFGGSTGVVATGAGSGTYDTPNAGTGKTVTSSGGTADATFAGAKKIYGLNVASISAAVGTITPAPVVIQPVSVGLVGTTSKVYDGTTIATLTPGNFSLTGFVAGDSASVTQTTGFYGSKNVGTGISVFVPLAPGDFSPGVGTLLSNYSFPSSASGLIGTIRPRPLTVAATAANKVFDGTTTATVTGLGLSGFVPGESLNAMSLSASFDTNQVGAGKTVTVSGISLVDGSGLASNYTVVGSATTLASITGASGAAPPVVPPVTPVVPVVPNVPGFPARSIGGTPNDFVVTFLEKFQVAVLDQDLKRDSPREALADIVLEGEICRP
jgi:filamentous hemagglutinin family protein